MEDLNNPENLRALFECASRGPTKGTVEPTELVTGEPDALTNIYGLPEDEFSRITEFAREVAEVRASRKWHSQEMYHR